MTIETSRYPFTPPAIEGIRVGALDSATDGATMLDSYASTPAGRNFLAHALVQLARDGWLRINPDPGAAWEPINQRTDRPTPAPEDPEENPS